MSLKNFTKRNVESIRGTQSSEYDELLPEFVNGGDILEWVETDVSRTKAAAIARRLNVLCEAKGINKKFHSGFNKLNDKAFVRLRLEGELDKKEKEEEEEEEVKPPDRSWMDDEEEPKVDPDPDRVF